MGTPVKRCPSIRCRHDGPATRGAATRATQFQTAPFIRCERWTSAGASGAERHDDCGGATVPLVRMSKAL
jgi:hypothetical protein